MITQLTWEAYTSVTVDFVKVLRLQKNSIMPYILCFFRYFTFRLLLVMLLLLARTGFLTIYTTMRLVVLLLKLSGLDLNPKSQHRKLLPLLDKEQQTRTGNHHSQQLLKKLGTGTTVGNLMISQSWSHMWRAPEPHDVSLSFGCNVHKSCPELMARVCTGA